MRRALMLARGWLPAGDYALVLEFARPLTPEEKQRVLGTIKAETPRLEREGITITGVDVGPERAVVRFRARVMSLLPLIVWGIIAAVVAVGVAVAAWKVQQAVPEVPWELLAPVGALGAVAFLVYSLARG